LCAGCIFERAERRLGRGLRLADLLPCPSRSSRRFGDDYPVVLRQMKANESKYLFVGQYVGTGATREQFIKTFATANIRVVFAEEI
jgi:hypothetical protein